MRIITEAFKTKFASIREKLEQRGNLEINSYIVAQYILKFPNKYPADFLAYCQGIIDFTGTQPGPIPDTDPDTL